MPAQPPFSFTIDTYSVGTVVELSIDKTIGSAFVIDDPSTVMTACHVAVDSGSGSVRQLAYLPPTTTKSGPPRVPVPIKLNIYKQFPELDIAVFRFEGQSPCVRSLKRSTSIPKVGEWVAYGGLFESINFRVSSHQVMTASTANGAASFQILGEAVPGYSGGPVFDQQGGVIGVILRGLPAGPNASLFECLAMASIPA